MEVIRGIGNIREKHRGSVLTIGNFDGVHKGHQAILKSVTEKAKELGTHSILICFEPQPKEFFDVFNAPARLTRFREKVELLAEHGIDYVLCLKFDERTRSMNSDDFISLLSDELGARAVFVGDDFRFGQDRSGTFEQLQQAGRERGFEVHNMYTLAIEEERVSSTRIRECLKRGDFAMAEKLLGYPYSITGKVVYGRQLGRQLGVPTANIQLHRYVAPIAGVFACDAIVGGRTYRGVANVGVRPTVDKDAVVPILEVHLFDFDEDIYGQNVRVIFRYKIRDEKKFGSLDELKEAIEADIRTAREYFA